MYLFLFFRCHSVADLRIVKVAFGGLTSALRLRLFLVFHAEIRSHIRAMCNQKLGSVDDLLVTFQRSRWRSAVIP